MAEVLKQLLIHTKAYTGLYIQILPLGGLIDGGPKNVLLSNARYTKKDFVLEVVWIWDAARS